MPRTRRILAAGEPRGAVVDTLLLKFDERRRQQGFAFGGKGTCVEFDFPDAPVLRTDDLLVLDDGNLIEVVADAEPVLEVRATDVVAVARLVWTLGNRHLPVEVLANRIRVLRTSETEALLAAHGLAATALTAPFDPMDGAAAHAPGREHDHHDHDPHHGHAHHHGHEHHQGHGHGDRGHGHHHDHRHRHDDEHREHGPGDHGHNHDPLGEASR